MSTHLNEYALLAIEQKFHVQKGVCNHHHQIVFGRTLWRWHTLHIAVLRNHTACTAVGIAVQQPLDRDEYVGLDLIYSYSSIHA